MSKKKVFRWGYVVLPILLVTICVWGASSLLFSNCDALPEDPNVEVVISACRKPHLYSISPDGKYLVYGAEKQGIWLQNLNTGEEQALSAAGHYWLSDQWLLQEADIQGERLFWVFDVRDGTQTPLQWVHGMPGMTSRLDDETLVFSPEVLIRFQKAETVYFVPESLKIAVALAPDFKTHPEDSYVLATPRSYRGRDPEAITAFLTDNDISYVEIKNKYYYYPPDPLPSHNGHFIATGTRIMTPAGKVVVQTQELFGVIYGWAHDDSGVYFQLPRLRNGPFLMLLFRVGKAEPILKLKVPEKYLHDTTLSQF